jgi:hypothetical protein
MRDHRKHRKPGRKQHRRSRHKPPAADPGKQAFRALTQRGTTPLPQPCTGHQRPEDGGGQQEQPQHRGVVSGPRAVGQENLERPHAPPFSNRVRE